MPTFRSEVSKSNPYYLPKHRTLELKHFCLQYPDWIRRYNDLVEPQYGGYLTPLGTRVKDNCIPDPTGQQAVRLRKYGRKIDMVNNAAYDADDELAQYILIHVTQGYTYDYICLNIDQIPCCQEVFYNKCRRFYWILSNYRD